MSRLKAWWDSHLTVLMVDLDNFKVVNDTRGRAAGDRALLAVAELLARCSAELSNLSRGR